MHATLNLFLFLSAPHCSTAPSPISYLIQFLGTQPRLHLTVIEADQQAVNKVSCHPQGNNTTILRIPRPENRSLLEPFHNLQQFTYGRRLADILHPYLQCKAGPIFLADSVNFIRVFEILKERYQDARFIYVHREWSWKRYLHLPDHVFSTYWKKGDITLSPKAFELTAYEQKMALIADRTVTISEQATTFFKDVLNIPPGNVKMIRNGTTYSGITENTPAELRARYGFTANEKIILYAGDINRDGGIYYLMEAFRHIAAERDKVKLLIAGRGDHCELLALAQQQWSKVVFAGDPPAEELSELMLLADIGVAPSLYGQWSSAAHRMRLNKLPLIVSASDGLGETFEDGTDALTLAVRRDDKHAPSLDIKQLEQKIKLLLDDGALARRLSENSYRTAIEQSGLNDMCNNYLLLLYSLTA